MLRFSVNLSVLFTELAWSERFIAAKQRGFNAVEIQFPYHLPAQQIRDWLLQADLSLVLFNVNADNLLQGGEGLASVPEKRAQFRVAVQQAAAYAEILQPDIINVLPGRCIDANRQVEYLDTFKDNLLYAADTFSEIGVRTVFEAINTFDMPGFIIHTGQQMLDILDELRHPNLAMQYDIYHLTRMSEHCAKFLNQHIAKIGHIQFADCPGRGEPSTGSIDFVSLFKLIRESDYAGWVGAEYFPAKDRAASFSWLDATN